MRKKKLSSCHCFGVWKSLFEMGEVRSSENPAGACEYRESSPLDTRCCVFLHIVTGFYVRDVGQRSWDKSTKLQ